MAEFDFLKSIGMILFLVGILYLVFYFSIGSALAPPLSLIACGLVIFIIGIFKSKKRKNF